MYQTIPRAAYDAQGQLSHEFFELLTEYDTTVVTILRYAYTDSSVLVKQFDEHTVAGFASGLIGLTEFVYDEAGRVVRSIRVLSAKEQYSYTYAYDRKGRIVRTTYTPQHYIEASWSRQGDITELKRYRDGQLEETRRYHVHA